MAGGFHTEDIDKLCRICCQFLGKENYNKENHKHKIEKMYFININSDNPLLHPKKICQKCYSAMSTAIKRKGTTSTSPFNNWTQHTEKCEICQRVQLLQKGIIGKRMLKVKAARKGRPKNDAKDSTWTQSFFSSLFSQIKSDDIPSEVKLSDVNNTDINPHITLCCCNSCGEILKKPIKVVKCEHRFCLNCLAACLSGKYEEESQCPVCKINILKTDISPSSDLQILRSLLKIQCKRCSKKFLISTHYNHYAKHIQNCSLDIHQPAHFCFLTSSIYLTMISQDQWRMPHYTF